MARRGDPRAGERRFRTPRGMRPSTLEERRSFYERELDLKGVERWLSGHPNAVVALILGRHTGVVLPEYARIRDHTVVVDEYEDLEDLRDYILQYLPEGVYYDRNLYRRRPACARWRGGYPHAWGCADMMGQQLAFDIDPENVVCPVHGDIQRKMAEGQALGFCEYELEGARRLALELWDELGREWSDVRATYSGRGFHLHVMDREAYGLKRRERGTIARAVKRRFPIDVWVTAGEMRLIRLPHSLNGMVSRVCMPLTKRGLRTFRADAPAYVPRFLGHEG
jgi:DNA primase catalytic subunit